MKPAFTVFYNPDTGELYDIVFTEDFLQESGLLRADVMGDVVDTLEEKEEGAYASFEMGLKVSAFDERVRAMLKKAPKDG
jgi:hypothetical protein